MLNRTRERKELMKIAFRYPAREVSDLYCVPCFTHDSGGHQTEKNISISCDTLVKFEKCGSFGLKSVYYITSIEARRSFSLCISYERTFCLTLLYPICLS